MTSLKDMKRLQRMFNADVLVKAEKLAEQEYLPQITALQIDIIAFEELIKAKDLDIKQLTANIKQLNKEIETLLAKDKKKK